MSKRVLTKTTAAVFPRGSKKRRSNSDEKHEHGQEQRRTSTFIEGKILPCFGKPEPDEISITEDISYDTERKHRTIEQDIKEAGPQRKASIGQSSRL